MNGENDAETWQTQAFWWLLYSISWVGNSALAFWLMLQLRVNTIDIHNALGGSPWILIAIDKFGFLLLGIGWLIAVFGIEIYLRGSPTTQVLLRRSRTILYYTLGGNLLSYGLQQWLV